jgi:hypothetical protein
MQSTLNRDWNKIVPCPFEARTKMKAEEQKTNSYSKPKCKVKLKRWKKNKDATNPIDTCT